MTNKNQLILSSFTFLFTILFITFFSFSGNAQTLYSCESPRGGPNPFLHTIDPNTGATLTTTEITLPGVEIRGCNGLSRDPNTGVCWIVLSPPGAAASGGGNAQRLLATIDQDTGVATLVGNTGERIAGIAFNTNGDILYGITGDADGLFIPKIVTLSKLNGSSTFIQNLPDDDDPGEAIGFNPSDGLIYRASGDGPVLDVDLIYESINPANMNVTQIPITGDTTVLDEQLSFVRQSKNLFLISQGRTPGVPNALHSITTSGVVSFIGNMDHQSKGLAFQCGVAPPSQIPTLSEWGLLTMAIILGVVGFMVIRRKRAIA
ncbi:MAG: IPTL-CTERM sorting domain-containing protein [Candidatus Dadabacteria bacterium]|nr:IPTL-CTERM sorting domain-containing protein [Candidatus Dadabacteria bacterium]